jgi:ubiquinone/menaquinone biosynthesis C-methylase UbiE
MILTLKQWARNILGLKKIQNAVIDEAEFKKEDRVIDIGCGTGSLLSRIHDIYGNSIEYMGIEPDEKTRSVADNCHGEKGIKFKRAFADHLPSVQDYYTHVICMVSFHHFPRESWKACLEECSRILAPGGKLIIVEFGNPVSLKGRILSLVNTCRALAKGIEFFLRTEAPAYNLILIGEKKQFDYISHFIFTKK